MCWLLCKRSLLWVVHWHSLGNISGCLGPAPACHNNSLVAGSVLLVAKCTAMVTVTKLWPILAHIHSKHKGATYMNTPHGQVERGTSETARQTLKGRKIWGWCICEARKASAEPNISVLISWKVAHWGKWWGPKDQADSLAVVVLWRREDKAVRPVAPSLWAHFWRHLTKTAEF